MQLTSYDGSEVAELMHRFDVDSEVWREAPNIAYQCGKITRVGRYESPVVDGDPVRRGYFLPVERGVKPRDNRPRVRVGASLACEVTGIEFLEGGVDVVGVERNERCDPIFGVDLDEL